jgi:hypothetical protein
MSANTYIHLTNPGVTLKQRELEKKKARVKSIEVDDFNEQD